LTSGCGNFSEAFQPPELFVLMRSFAFAPALSLFCDNFFPRRVSSRLAQALTFAAAILLAGGLCGTRGAPAQESGPIVVNSVLELEADDLADTAGILAPFASFEEGSTIVIDLGARDLEVGPQGAILVPPSRQFAFPDPPAFGPEESQGRGLGNRQSAGPARWGGGWGDDDDDNDHHGGGGHHGDDDDDDHHHGQSGDRGSPHLWIKSSGSLIVRAPSEPDRAGRSGGERNGGGHHDDDDDDHHHDGHDDDDEGHDDHGGPNLPRGKGAIETSARNGRAGDIFLDFSGSVVVLGSVRSIQEKDPNNSVSTAGAITLRSAGGDVIVGVGGLVANWGEKPGTGPISLVSCGGDVAVQGLVLNRKGLFAHHPPVINVASFAGDVHIDGGALALNDFQPAGPKMDLTGGLMTFAKGSEAAGWIDIEALGDVFISRDTTGVWLNRESRAAVANVHHENEGDNGGAIRVRALEGSISARDRALEAVGKKNNSAALIELFAEQDVELLTPAAPWGQRSPTIDVDHEQNSHQARGGTCQLRSRSGSVIVEAGAKVEAEKTVAKVGPGGTVQILPGAVVAGLQTQVEQASAVEGLFGGCGDFGELPALPAVQFSPAVYAANETASSVLLTVELDSALAALLDEPASVDYATADETALAGQDYVAASGTLVFALGETSKTLEIALLQDQVNEPAETFRVLLSNPSNAVLGEAAEAVVALENDPIPQLGFRVAQLAASEAEGGALAILEVELLFSQGAPASVDFASEDLSALAGDDYEAVSGTLTFEPGEFLKTIEIPILADQINEPAEDFRVSLSNPSGAILGLSQATVSIENLFSPPTLGFTESFFPVTETTEDFFVELTVAMTGPETPLPASMAYRTLEVASSPPQAGLDYEPAQGVLTFLPGERSKTIQVPILADGEDFESEENLIVLLSDFQNAKPGPQLAEIIISDPSTLDFFPPAPDPVTPGGETIETEIPVGGMFCYEVEVSPEDGHLLVKASVEEGLGDVALFMGKSPALPTISHWDYASLTEPGEDGGDFERVAIALDSAIPLSAGVWFICVYGSGPNESDPDAPIPVTVTIDPGPGAPPAEEEEEPEPPAEEGPCGQRRPLSGFSGTDSQNAFAFDDAQGEFAPPSASAWSQHHYALWCFQFLGDQYGSFVILTARAPQAGPEDRLAIALRASCAGGETLGDYASIEGSAAAPEGVQLVVGGLFNEFFTVVVDATAPLNIELSWEASTELQPACDRAGAFINPCVQRTAFAGYQGRTLSAPLGFDGTLEGLQGFGCADEPGGLVGEYWTAFSLTAPEAGFIEVELEQRLRPLGDLAAEIRSCCGDSAEGVVLACGRSQPGGAPQATLSALLPAPGTYTVLVNASRSDPPVTARWNSEFYLSSAPTDSDCQVAIPQIVPSADPDNPAALPDKAFVFAEIGAGQTHHYAVEMPSSFPALASLRLTLETPLGSGADPDLYVRQGAAPTLENWDLRPFLGGGAREFVWINSSTNPPLAPGEWRVAVHGARPGPYRLKATLFEPTLPPPLRFGRLEGAREVVVPEDCPHINNEFIPDFLLKYFCDSKAEHIDIDVMRGDSEVGFSEEYRNLFGALVPANNNFDKLLDGEPLIECLDGLPAQDNFSFSPLAPDGEVGIDCPPTRFIVDLSDPAISRGRISFRQPGFYGFHSSYTTDFGFGFRAYDTIYTYSDAIFPYNLETPVRLWDYNYTDASKTVEFLIEGLEYGASPYGPKVKAWLSPGTLDERGIFHPILDNNGRIPRQEESVRMRVVQALFKADLDADFKWTWNDVRARGSKPGLLLSSDSLGFASPTVFLGGGNIIADKLLFSVPPPETPQVYLTQEGEGRVDVLTSRGSDLLPFDQNQSVDLAQYYTSWGREYAYQDLIIKPRITGQLKLKFIYTLQGIGEGGGFAGDFIVGDELQITIEDLVDLDVDSDNDNGFNSPDQDDAEDAIENLPGEPGKFLLASAADFDGDGFPDTFEDFDGDGILDYDDMQIGASPSTSEPAHFVPLILSFPIPASEGLRPIDPERAQVSFAYQSSDPQFSGGLEFSQEAGLMRIWTKDAGEARNPLAFQSEQPTPGGRANVERHYIAARSYFDLKDLPPFEDGKWKFFLEGLTAGESSISVFVREKETGSEGQRDNNDNLTLHGFDTVKTIAFSKIDLRADINNNGVILDENGNLDYFDDPKEDPTLEEALPGMFVRVNNDDDDLDSFPDNQDFVIIENPNSRTSDLDDLRPLKIRSMRLFDSTKTVELKLSIENFDYEQNVNIFQLFNGEYIYLNFDENKEYSFGDVSRFHLLRGVDLYVEGVEPSEVKLEASLFYSGHLAAQDTVAITVGPPNIDADANNDGFFTVQGDDPWENPGFEEDLNGGMIISYNNDDDDRNGIPDRNDEIIDNQENLLDLRKIWIRNALLKNDLPIYIRKINLQEEFGKIRIFRTNGSILMSENDNIVELEKDVNGNIKELELFVESTQRGKFSILLTQNDIELDKTTLYTDFIYSPYYLSFKDNVTLISDDENIIYESPHYYNPNLDNTLDTNERAYPVCYKAESKIKVDVEVAIPNGLSLDNYLTNKWKIRGAILDIENSTTGVTRNITFNAIEAELINDSRIKATDLVMDQNLPDEIDFFGTSLRGDNNPLLLTWEISPDNGKRWYYVGGTSNLFYIINNNNILLNKYYNSLFYNSCKFADGINININDSEEIITGIIWDGFKIKNGIPGPIYRLESTNRPLIVVNQLTADQVSYWQGKDLNNDGDVEDDGEGGAINTIAEDTHSLLLNGNGKCTSWARIFLDTLKVQGIREATNIIEVEEINYDDLNTWFLVKDYEFIPSNHASIGGIQRDSDFPYIIIINNGKTYYTEVIDKPGVRGQGNRNPVSEFENHVFCISHNSGVLDSYLDPSYGSTYSSEIDFEYKAIDGYFIKSLRSVNESLIPNPDGTMGVDLNNNNDKNDIIDDVDVRQVREKGPGFGIQVRTLLDY
jgi:hypothetical protein